MDTNRNLLEIKNLTVNFSIYKSVVQAIRGLNLQIRRGETLGLVGESGCGKSVTSMSILRLIPIPPGNISSGEIWFEGENLLTKSEDEMRRIRGKTISMIFQDPMTSLNPVFSVGDQIITVIRIHQGVKRSEAIGRARDMFTMVGLSDPATLLKKYPHELSGGMSQRVMIAMALSCRPSLLIADEPTTALDVTIQAQILELIESLKEKIRMSVIMITHDLGVIAETAQKVSVMYAGHVVEEAPVKDLFHAPLHPYTIGLLESLPRMDQKKGAQKRLRAIRGMVPDLLQMPAGCPFEPRCDWAKQRCREDLPKLRELKSGHWVSCWEAKP